MSKCGIKKITIDGVDYVEAEKAMTDSFDGMKYAIVRTQNAGVFAGYIESKNGMEVVMKQARRLWYWMGAASLSQLAMEGTSSPSTCKFPIAVDRVELTQVIEILDVSKEAKESIDSVQIWKA